jgi:hypothetical protein
MRRTALPSASHPANVTMTHGRRESQDVHGAQFAQ